MESHPPAFVNLDKSRNTSRASLANLTTRRWESSSECVSWSQARRKELTSQCAWDITEDPPLVTKDSSLPDATQSSPNQNGNADEQAAPSSVLRVSYLTEQTSHHPPVSAFYVDCPKRGITACGYDQLSAKFTGTAIRVTPGAHNLGIFITLAQRDGEEYQLTHPAAQLGGLLRGSLSVSVADICFIRCPKTRVKVILHYMEEGWLGKSQNKVNGVVFRYDPDNDKYTRIKDVPSKDILATLDGNWQEQVYYSLPSKSTSQPAQESEGVSDKHLLVDLTPLTPVPKIVPADEDQLPTESRRFWKDVTAAIMNKQYAEATRIKQVLEQRQRDKAGERKAKNEEWKPRFFKGAVLPKGTPHLSPEGELVLKGLHEGNFKLEQDASGA
jgi:oxysterol-binding protein-related protein 9/10/11